MAAFDDTFFERCIDSGWVKIKRNLPYVKHSWCKRTDHYTFFWLFKYVSDDPNSFDSIRKRNFCDRLIYQFFYCLNQKDQKPVTLFWTIYIQSKSLETRKSTTKHLLYLTDSV